MKPASRDLNSTLRADPVIAGVDEAGRGPLAGPVVAAACILTHEVRGRRVGAYKAWSPVGKQFDEHIIADSKALSPEQRETTFSWLTETCPYGIGWSSAEEIDADGILAATERAMQAAIAMMAERTKPTYLLVDGRDAFWFDYPHSSIVRGDATEPCIAAASIIAKVSRDRWMCEQARLFPQYGFQHHKGYASDVHCDAIRTHGPCALHRKTFLTRIVAQPVEA